MGRFAKRLLRRARKGLAHHAAPVAAVPAMVQRSHGRVNAYTCQLCGEVTWTYDRDEGTTPFMDVCRVGCGKGTAHSAFYRVPRNHPAPTHEWYRADAEWVRREEKKYPGSQQHHDSGGLFIRPIATEQGAPTTGGCRE